MSVFKFEDIAFNSTEKKKPVDQDKYTYLGLEHLDPDSIYVTRFGAETAPKGDKLIMKKGDVLFGKRRAYQKKVAIAPFDGIFSAHGMVLRPKEEVIDKDFFPMFIKSDYFLDAAIKISVGSLSPTINWRDLKELKFELPSLEEQRKLAEVLWAIYDMKDKYKKLILATDELVKSQFIEMFGNVKEYAFLADCCSIHARVGWQALKKDEYMEQGEYMLITGTDFVDGRVDFSTCVYVSKERYDMDEKIQVRNGDILVTKDGTIGKVAIVEGLDMPATLNAGVFVIRPDGRFDADFFSYLFKGPVFSEFVEAVKSGATIKHLNQGKLQKYEIPQASMELQTEFAELYRQSDKSKFALQEAIKDLDALSKKIIAENLIPAGKE